jgi:murein DD-endopeptidase MepM/ murein hydrolase activator NlpD
VLEDSPAKGPFVLNLRLSGRLVPFLAMLLLFALLPFLGGPSAPERRADVVLAAGTPAAAAVPGPANAVGAAGQGLPVAGSGALLGETVAAGGGNVTLGSAAGGLLLFPALSLTPSTGLVPAAGPNAGAALVPVGGLPAGAQAGAVGFIHPVPGAEASPFGPRIHPVLHRAMFHTGIDLQAACGTPIHAAAAGTVIYARVSDSWGLRTIIQHTAGIKTAYGHQTKFLVKEGDVVAQGQVIGLVGTTGWSTGCHLHFDVIINDRYVDPAPYLGFPASAADAIPYAVVPHLVMDNGTRVRTVQDGDVPIPTRSSGGSTSSVDEGGSVPSVGATSSATGTWTGVRTATGRGTATGTATSSGTPTSTKTATGTMTTPAGATGTPRPSGSTTATLPPATTTTTTTTAAPTTTTVPPATTTTTSTATTTAAEAGTTTDTSTDTSSAAVTSSQSTPSVEGPTDTASASPTSDVPGRPVTR